jgi:hypothetical protein
MPSNCYILDPPLWDGLLQKWYSYYDKTTQEPCNSDGRQYIYRSQDYQEYNDRQREAYRSVPDHEVACCLCHRDRLRISAMDKKQTHLYEIIAQY